MTPDKTRRDFVLGLDLGQVADYSALAVARKTGAPAGPVHRVGHLERWRGVPYPAAVGRVRDVVQALREAAFREQRPGTPEPTFAPAVDATGVGRAVVDLFRAERRARASPLAAVTLLAVTITGGTEVTEHSDEARVPKRELAGAVQALLQTERLRIAPELELAETLTQELTGFRVKIDLTTGHDSYGAGEDWRSAPHDDLVLAVALAVWHGEHLRARSGCGSVGYLADAGRFFAEDTAAAPTPFRAPPPRATPETAKPDRSSWGE